MLLDTLNKRWKEIEEIGSDAEKRGKFLGIELSWQPRIIAETSDYLPETTPAQSALTSAPAKAKPRNGFQKLREIRRAKTRVVRRKVKKSRAAG